MLMHLSLDEAPEGIGAHGKDKELGRGGRI